MDIKPQYCPKCSAALQLMQLSDTRMRVCRCGYGEPIEPPETERDIIKYVEDLTRATITQLSKKSL